MQFNKVTLALQLAQVLLQVTPITGAIYARISHDRKGEELGVQRQVDRARERAAVSGITVPADLVFVDNDLSAMDPRVHREDYGKLLDAVRTGKVKVVIVYQTSRLWRNRRERLDGIELFRRMGVNVLVVRGTDMDLSTASGRLIAGIEGEVSAWESEVKAERMADEHLQRALLGLPPRGPRCFGYDETGWHPADREDEAVADLFRGLLRGHSVTGLADLPNDRGLLTSRGNPFTPATVRKLLCNERYCGLRYLNGEWHQGHWDQLVSEAQWRAAVAIIKDPGRRRSFSTERRHLGSNLYLCGPCELAGRRTTLRPQPRGEGKRGYRCRDHGHLVRLADPIDAYVVGVVVERLSRSDAVDLLVDDDRLDAEALQAEALALRERMASIAGLLGRGAMTAGQFELANREAQEALETVQGKMRDAQRAPVLLDLVSARDARRAWEATPLEQQRRVVDTLMTVTVLNTGPGRWTFNPDSVRVDWKVLAS